MPLFIRLFEPRDQSAVRQLILAGLGEHFGWIDEMCNPDLDDITANYIESGHVFVVAEIDGELVGTGALTAEDENTGRIVRMSVKQTHRRKGIGRALVTHLLEQLVAAENLPTVGLRPTCVSAAHAVHKTNGHTLLDAAGIPLNSRPVGRLVYPNPATTSNRAHLQFNLVRI